MTIMYMVLSETDDEAEIEFIDSEATLSHKRKINITGLKTNEARQERYQSHERTFVHRLGLGIIKEPEPVKDSPKVDEELPEKE